MTIRSLLSCEWGAERGAGPDNGLEFSGNWPKGTSRSFSWGTLKSKRDREDMWGDRLEQGMRFGYLKNAVRRISSSVAGLGKGRSRFNSYEKVVRLVGG